MSSKNFLISRDSERMHGGKQFQIATALQPRNDSKIWALPQKYRHFQTCLRLWKSKKRCLGFKLSTALGISEKSTDLI